ncbi:MAG: hypothetical protein WCP92_07220 [bacterium]
MKKLVIIIYCMVFPGYCFSQITEIKGGFILNPQVSSAGEIDFNKMQVSVPLLSNINFITPKTYHNICYVWGANALVLVNGWIYHPKGKQDIYLVTSKNLATSGGNVMIAWETELTNGNVSVWGAIEVGTSWNKRDQLLINLCLTMPFQASIWKKK